MMTGAPLRPVGVVRSGPHITSRPGIVIAKTERLGLRATSQADGSIHQAAER